MAVDYNVEEFKSNIIAEQSVNITAGEETFTILPPLVWTKAQRDLYNSASDETPLSAEDLAIALWGKAAYKRFCDNGGSDVLFEHFMVEGFGSTSDES